RRRGAVKARVKPKRRGAWLAAASGQMLRPSPGATKNSSGRTGTTRRQKTNSPADGCSTSITHRPRNEPTLSSRTPGQRGDCTILCSPPIADGGRRSYRRGTGEPFTQGSVKPAGRRDHRNDAIRRKRRRGGRHHHPHPAVGTRRAGPGGGGPG